MYRWYGYFNALSFLASTAALGTAPELLEKIFDWEEWGAAVISTVSLVFLLTNAQALAYFAEWAFRGIDVIGLAAIHAQMFVIEWAWYTQAAVGICFLIMAAYDPEVTEDELGFFLNYAALTFNIYGTDWFKEEVLALLALRRDDLMKPSIDWSFFQPEDVNEDGQVVINMDNFEKYKSFTGP